ncbi:unnamed protein product [Lepidochelys olivacea]
MRSLKYSFLNFCTKVLCVWLMGGRRELKYLFYTNQLLPPKTDLFANTVQETAYLLLNSAAVTESNLKNKQEQAEFVRANPDSLNIMYMKYVYYTMAEMGKLWPQDTSGPRDHPVRPLSSRLGRLAPGTSPAVPPILQSRRGAGSALAHHPCRAVWQHGWLRHGTKNTGHLRQAIP